MTPDELLPEEAEKDRRAAHVLLEPEPSRSLFHSRQLAEKAVKAFLTSQHTSPMESSTSMISRQPVGYPGIGMAFLPQSSHPSATRSPGLPRCTAAVPNEPNPIFGHSVSPLRPHQALRTLTLGANPALRVQPPHPSEAPCLLPRRVV
jgi:hypothetical protein